MIPFIDLQSQYKRLQEGMERRIRQTLEGGQYIMGPEVAELESALANYIGAKHCLAVSSGTDALLMALMALDLGPEDEVIVPDFSFFATAEVVELLRAKLVYADIDPQTYNLCPQDLKRLINKKTKAIIPVSLYGQCADFDEINAIADEAGVVVIEDGAQSFGATYKDKKSLNLSAIGCTSFFPSKPLGAYGDGGAIFTNDDALLKKLSEIRIHGQAGRYHHVRVGLNARMDSLQAAILLEKLTIFDDEFAKRQQIARRYSELIPGDFVRPFIREDRQSVYAQYTIQYERREELVAFLNTREIPTAVHYPMPLSKQPALSHIKGETCPVSWKTSQSVLSLPFHPYLSETDQDKVIEGLRDFLRKKA